MTSRQKYTAAASVWLLNVAGVILCMIGVLLPSPALSLVGGSLVGIVAMLCALLILDRKP